MPPFSRIQATATAVSRPPEKAMPMRSPTGSDWRTRVTGESVGAGRARSALGRDLATAVSSSAALNAPSNRERMTPFLSTTKVNGSLRSFHSSTHWFVPLAGSLSL